MVVCVVLLFDVFCCLSVVMFDCWSFATRCVLLGLIGAVRCIRCSVFGVGCGFCRCLLSLVAVSCCLLWLLLFGFVCCLFFA